MQQKLRLYTPVIVVLIVLSAVLTALAFPNRMLFFISAALTCAVYIAVLLLLRHTNKQTRQLLAEIEQGVRNTLDGDLTQFPMPVMTIHGSEIVWYNDLCAQLFFDGRDMRGEDVSDVLLGVDLRNALPTNGYDIEYGGKMYTAFITHRLRGDDAVSVVYLVEDTQLKFYASEYHRTKPSIALIVVDNYEEMMQDYKDSERAQIMGDIEGIVEAYMAEHQSFVTKVSRDRYIAVIQEQGYEEMLSGKFDLLDKVRALQVGDRMKATLSIGVGRDAGDLFEAEAMARQALDMCLGRGGDQAAIKTQNGYEFYGGVSKAIEKRTKVKTRIIAAALGELIETSSNVIIMGHRFADLDCLGSAVGILKAVRAMNKPSVIAIDQTKNLVKPLLKKLALGGYGPADFVRPADALDLVDNGTLLIITDTHVPHVLESEELYRACKHVVVIDHHRKLATHIDNAVIFYHEPYASSTCEMVAELVQYFPVQPQINRVEAEAMMAGIMLDTKNFVLRTGVRTFEAAAYLRRLGADTVEVRKLFASSMDAYQQKAALVSTAEIHHGCAIAVSDYGSKDIKIVAPQAADELMTISGVEASFIIFAYDNVINISARSLGAFNVQVIMEKLGGGGHQTMAAAQFPDDNIDNVRTRLMEVIASYSTPTMNQPKPPTHPQLHHQGQHKEEVGG